MCRLEELETRVMLSNSVIAQVINTGPTTFAGIAGVTFGPITARYANFEGRTAVNDNVPMKFEVVDLPDHVLFSKTVVPTRGVAVLHNLRLTIGGGFQLWAFPDTDTAPWLADGVVINAARPASMQIASGIPQPQGNSLLIKLYDRFGNEAGGYYPFLTIEQSRKSRIQASFDPFDVNGDPLPSVIIKHGVSTRARFFGGQILVWLRETGSPTGVPVKLICSAPGVKPITATALPSKA